MFLNELVLLFLLIIGCLGEEPQKICDPSTPFKKNDHTCGSFNDICVKTNDNDCNYFQKACQQCPPTSYSVIMFNNIIGQLNHSNSNLDRIKNQVNRSNLNLEGIKNQINISASRMKVSMDSIDIKSTKEVSIVIACLIFILLNFIFNIYYFFKENKKRRLPKLRYRQQSDGSSSIENEYLIGNKTNDQPYYNTQLLEDIKNKIDEKAYVSLDSITSYKLRFQVANQINETELFVSKFDNVIKLKKSICDGNMNDYKRMMVKYKDVTLDNNQYLLSCIDSTNICPIFCEFDDNVDVDAMIVIKLKCDNIYPEMLQIWKHQTIKHLKIIISKLNKTNHEDLLIFYKSNQLNDNDKTIDDYMIEDNDWINVVNKSQEMQNITMKSIFNAKETISIEISKSETVSSIIDKSIEKMKNDERYNITINHFAVFLNKKLLENEKLIYEYNIDSKSLIEFCYFKGLNEVISLLTNLGHINMFKPVNNSNRRPVIFKAYDKEYMEKAHEKGLSMILRKDLQMFQITKSHSRFMQLFGIYIGTDHVFIKMEFYTKGSLKSVILSNIEISTYQISKWAYQILEGLTHLHSHNIILKDMNTTDVKIDGNLDIKLPSFNMTEYLKHLDDTENKHRVGVLTFVAPEILEGKHYEASVDVWSLGVIMMELVKHGELFPGLEESKIVKIIKESRTIEYDKSNKPADLISFIDCCVKGNPKERSTIDQLMKHEFIENYL